MPATYVRYILFKAARDRPIGSFPGSVSYYDYDQEAEALAAGEAWIASGNHPWYAVFGQTQDGRLVRIAGEDT